MRIVIACFLALDLFGAVGYSGKSDYRLVFHPAPSLEFKVTTDLTAEPTWKEKMEGQVSSALIKALVPLMGTLSGNRTGTEGALLPLVNTLASSLGQDLRRLWEGKKAGGEFPFIHDTYLIPWSEKRENLFYDADKVSMQSTELVNVLAQAKFQDRFADKLTENIRVLQKSSAGSTDPVVLLALRSFLMLQKDKATLTLRVLLALKPRTEPFVQENEKAKFQKLVIPALAGSRPALPGSWPVVSLLFSFDLGEAKTVATCKAEFGEFVRFDPKVAGNFVLSDNRVEASPRLVGQAAVLKKWVPVEISFSNLRFDMQTLKVDALETLVSPGIRFGLGYFGVQGLHMKSVDQEFQAEINRNIQKEIDKATAAGEKKIQGVSTDYLENAFSVLMGGPHV